MREAKTPPPIENYSKEFKITVLKYKTEHSDQTVFDY